MTTSPKPADWRDSLRGFPIAALTEQGITRIFAHEILRKASKPVKERV